MNITKDIINDLLPLYALQECSADTRALVDEYLASHPGEAADLRRSLQAAAAGPAIGVPSDLGETQALRRARRELRHRSVILALAIFFSAAPASFIVKDGQVTSLMQVAPGSAAFLLAAALGFWAAYALKVRRSTSL